MAAHAVLIDLDGTLWDSAPWYAYLLSSHTDHEDVAAVTAQLRTAGGGLNVASELRRAGFTNAKFARAVRGCGEELQLFEGAAETLRRAREAVELGVVTNLPAWMVDPMLAHVGMRDLFSVVQCATFGLRPKPSPAGILRAVGSIPDVDSARTLYVGDTASDAAASDAAGVQFLWASWGYDDVTDRDLLDSWSDLGARL